MKEVRAGTGQVGVAVGRPVLSPRKVLCIYVIVEVINLDEIV